MTKSATKLDLLKSLLRLAEDLKAIPTKRYLVLSEKLQEIGKMLGGWKKGIESKNSPKN